MTTERIKRKVGIDDMAIYVPNLYLDVRELAEKRGLEYDKLNKGLGITYLAVPDYHEDAATMAADAIAQIIDKNHLDPHKIGRIYLGTESALDGAKPTASYVVDMLQERYKGRFGEDVFNHCDVVDLTFACISGVDALQNTLDWAAHDKNRMGIVVCSDYAKYEIGSGGEYTQGAGAIAMLIKSNPRLMEIPDRWGVSTRSRHDFFKPIRTLPKSALIQEILEASEIQVSDQDKILYALSQRHGHGLGVLHSPDVNISLFKETPVFDGQYSNQCYQDRTREAFQDFKQQTNEEKTRTKKNKHSLSGDWERIIFHLPYAFQGKRMFPEIYALEHQNSPEWMKLEKSVERSFPEESNFENEHEFQKAKTEYLKWVSQTENYRKFIQEKTERSQRASSLIGNIYTGSIFLALMSSLESDFKEGNDLEGKKIAFFSYGSGSKSKVFEGTIQKYWVDVVRKFHLFERLATRRAIDFETYEKLHTGNLQSSAFDPENVFALVRVGEEGVHEGARYYQWIE